MPRIFGKNDGFRGTNQAIKAQLRQAIWSQAPDLALVEREVGLTKESGKEVWDQLQKHLPVYALFKSDRASTDQDAEAQDPLKSAIKEEMGTHVYGHHLCTQGAPTLHTPGACVNSPVSRS